MSSAAFRELSAQLIPYPLVFRMGGGSWSFDHIARNEDVSSEGRAGQFQYCGTTGDDGAFVLNEVVDGLSHGDAAD